MNSRDKTAYSKLMREMIDRICEGEKITRVILAEDLGVSKETVFRAVYEAKIGFDLILKICRRANASPEELWDVELAWMETKEDRPREQVFRQAMSVIRTLMNEVDSMEAFLRRKGEFDAYKRKRKGRMHPLLKRSKDQLDQKS